MPASSRHGLFLRAKISKDFCQIQILSKKNGRNRIFFGSCRDIVKELTVLLLTSAQLLHILGLHHLLAVGD